MGPWYLWCGFGVSYLRRNRGPEYRPGAVGAPRRHSACSPEAPARAHGSLQLNHPESDEPNGLVIVSSILPRLPDSFRFWMSWNRVLVGSEGLSYINL